MSNFYEQELRKLFEDGEIIDDPKFMGTVCIGTLGGDLRARAEFIPRGSADNCEALYLTVLRRFDGEVDKITLNFKDIWGRKPVRDCPNPELKETPHFWNDYGGMSWDGYQPTAADYQVLRQAAGDYLGMFRERMPERTMEIPAKKSPGRKTPKKSRDER